MFIMDAMRFDVFKEILEENKVSGSLLKVHSEGFETGVWMRKTFTEPEYKNIVLISNSVIYWKSSNRHLLPKFYKTNPLWKGWRKLNAFSYKDAVIHSTSEVLHEAQKDAVINKDKKLLIHELPPHLPFCEETGVEFTEKHMDNMVRYKAIVKYARDNKERWAEIREYYKRSAWMTLKTVLNCRWLRERGDLVITADHGEMIGEDNVYGHFQTHNNNPILRHVPWFEPL